MKQLLTGMSVLAFSALAFGQTTTTAISQSPATVTKAQLEEAKKDDKGPWSASFFQGFYAGTKDLNRGNAKGLYGDAFLGLGYKIDDQQSATVRQNIMYNQTDSAKTDEWALYDIAGIYKYKKLFQIAGSDIDSETRLYLPTSEWSADIGKIEARQAFATSMNIASKTTLALGTQGRAYTYTEDKAGQRFFRTITSATVTYEANKIASPYANLTHEGAWRHDGKALSPDGSRKEKENLYTAATFTLGANLALIDGFSTTLFADQTRDLRAEDQFVLGNEKEMSYGLEMAVSL